jgi:hypothetical protein
MALLVAGVVLCVVVVVGSGVEWGRLLVNGRLVVIEDGLSLWQGVVVLIAAAAGALAMALSVAASRGRPAALAALASGVVITVVSIQALVWLVTRPDAIAAQVKAGAEAIPLTGYVVPPIESVLGPGGWMALAAGILLLMLGLVALVVPAWRGRTGATRSSG